MKTIFTVLFALLCINLKAQENKIGASINVKGISSIKVQPDEGILNLNASFIGLDVNQAMLGLDKKTKEITQQIIAAGLSEKDLKTINFQINKNIVYRRGSAKDSGYFASQSLQVKFVYSKEKVAKILNVFSESKAGYIMNFDFILSDTLKKKTEATLMKLSIKDAKVKANLLTAEAGVKIKRIKVIEYGVVSANRTYSMLPTRSMSADGAGGEAMQGFTPNDIEMSDEVLIVWELEQ